MKSIILNFITKKLRSQLVKITFLCGRNQPAGFDLVPRLRGLVHKILSSKISQLFHCTYVRQKNRPEFLLEGESHCLDVEEPRKSHFGNGGLLSETFQLYSGSLWSKRKLLT